MEEEEEEEDWVAFGIIASVFLLGIYILLAMKGVI